MKFKFMEANGVGLDHFDFWQRLWLRRDWLAVYVLGYAFCDTR